MSAPSILHEDDHLIVIYKPSCMHSVNTAAGSIDSVETWLSSLYPSLKTHPSGESGITNRLDYETSGLMLAAKDPSTVSAIQTLTKKGLIKKEYLALVEGILDHPITVSKALGSRGRNSGKVRVFESPKPRDRALPAETQFFPVSISAARGCSIIKAVIFQGRRHQIRVHSSFINHPLTGDEKYGSKTAATFSLHSWKATFNHPATQKPCTFEAPIPESIRGARKEGVWRDLLTDIFGN